MSESPRIPSPADGLPDDCFTDNYPGVVALQPPFNKYFLVLDRERLDLYMPRKGQNAQILLNRVRNEETVPAKELHVLKVMEHFELYRAAVRLFRSPDDALLFDAAEVVDMFGRAHSVCQVLVYLAKNPRLDPGAALRSLRIEGDVSTRPDIVREILTWADYLRTGRYFDIARDTQLYREICETMTSDQALFPTRGASHAVLLGAEDDDTERRRFLMDVSDRLPWHPPVIRDARKSARDVVMSNYSPFWGQTDHYGTRAFYAFLSRPRARRYMIYKECLFWWRYCAGGEVGRVQERSRPLGAADLGKDDFNVFVYVGVTPGRRIRASGACCVRVNKNRVIPVEVKKAYEARWGGKLTWSTRKRAGLRVNAIVVFADKRTAELQVSERSCKFPHLTRIESIARFGLGDILHRLYAPTIYWSHKLEVEEFGLVL